MTCLFFGNNALVTPPECDSPLSNLNMTTFSFTHTIFDYQDKKYIAAMNKVREMIKAQKFSAKVFAVTMEYANWETTEIISFELYRNLGFSIACVFAATLLLLANVSGSILVMISVFLTLVSFSL